MTFSEFQPTRYTTASYDEYIRFIIYGVADLGRTLYNPLCYIDIERDKDMAELVPIVAAALIIYAAIDIYRSGAHDPRKSKRKNDDEMYQESSYDGDENWE